MRRQRHHRKALFRWFILPQDAKFNSKNLLVYLIFEWELGGIWVDGVGRAVGARLSGAELVKMWGYHLLFPCAANFSANLFRGHPLPSCVGFFCCAINGSLHKCQRNRQRTKTQKTGRNSKIRPKQRLFCRQKCHIIVVTVKA